MKVIYGTKHKNLNNNIAMDFKDAVLQLAERIVKQKDAITTEEGTKNAFIMPMIAALGYDVFNPFEVIPEMDCDIVKKRGEKIDYAIMKNERPIILLECKHWKQNLNLHDTQLQKYFVASNARFGVLANGIEYRFYTDLDKANIMDGKPFLVVNMLDLSDADIEQLKKFHKSYYNESEILSNAQELQITIQIKDILNKNFQSPGDEFTRYFVRCLNDGKSSPKLIEQYKTIIKKSIASIINDTISDRLSVAIKNEEQRVEDTKQEQQYNDKDTTPKLPDGTVAIDEENGIITTQEEIDAYNIIRSILRKHISANKIIYQDFKTYFSISLETRYWWVCRLYFGGRKKSICFATDDYKPSDKIELETIDDLFTHSEKLEKAFEIANEALKQYRNKHAK